MSHTLDRIRMAYRSEVFANAAIKQLTEWCSLPDGADFNTARCVIETAVHNTSAEQLPFENILEAIAKTDLSNRRKRKLAELTIRLRGNSGGIPREYALEF